MRRIFLIITFCFLATVTRAEEYYIGRYVWCSGNFNHWCPPQQQFLTGAIDLRSLPQQAAKGVNVGDASMGWALFSYSQLVNSPNLFNLTNALDKKLNNPTITKIQNELGITLQSTTVRDAIWEILTLHGDPTGQIAWKPLIPGIDLKRKVFFGVDGNIKEQAFEMFRSKGWELVLATEQNNYRELIKNEKYEIVARHLDWLEDKYGVFYGYFMPPDSVMIASLPHKTTITESFNTADSDTLGPDLSWTEVSADWDIVSNTAQASVTFPDGHTNARADSDLSSSDHYAQGDATSGTGGFPDVGFFVRFNSSALTGYIYMYQTFVGLDCIIIKYVSGTITTLIDSNDNHAGPSGTVMRAEVDGSSITGYFGGVSHVSVTDTAITGNVRTGIRAYRNTAGSPRIIDNFEAGDLAVFTPRQINYY